MSGLSVANLREITRDILGLDDTDLDDTDCDLLLNRSFWWLQSILSLPEDEVLTTIPTVAGQVNYSIGYPIEGVLSVSVKNDDDNELESLYPIGGYARDDLYSYDADAQGRPERFERFGRSLYLQPIPDAVYTLQIRRRELVSDITGATTQIALDSVLHDVLVFGAAERGFLELRDYNSSDRMKREWAIKLQSYTTQEEKEQTNWHYAQVKVMRPKYGV